MSDQVPPPNSPEPPSRSGGGAGDAAAPKEIILARWVDRFIAWLIDFVIVNAAVWIVVGLALASPFMLGTDQRMVIDREDGRPFFFDRGGPMRSWSWFGGFLPGALPFLITSIVFLAIGPILNTQEDNR
jgi:large-conductance mechanosensitive channel